MADGYHQHLGAFGKAIQLNGGNANNGGIGGSQAQGSRVCAWLSIFRAKGGWWDNESELKLHGTRHFSNNSPLSMCQKKSQVKSESRFQP